MRIQPPAIIALESTIDTRWTDPVRRVCFFTFFGATSYTIFNLILSFGRALSCSVNTSRHDFSQVICTIALHALIVQMQC